MKDVLAELRSLHSIYFPLWLSWIKDKACRLEAAEIEAINALTDPTGSALDHGQPLPHYPSVRHLLWKLQFDLPRFRRWVAEHFVNCLLYRSIRYKSGLNAFLSTPIQKLPISDELRMALTALGVNSLLVVMILYQSKRLITTIDLGLLIQCTAILIAEEKNIHTKMEVQA